MWGQGKSDEALLLGFRRLAFGSLDRGHLDDADHACPGPVDKGHGPALLGAGSDRLGHPVRGQHDAAERAVLVRGEGGGKDAVLHRCDNALGVPSVGDVSVGVDEQGHVSTTGGEADGVVTALEVLEGGVH